MQQMHINIIHRFALVICLFVFATQAMASPKIHKIRSNSLAQKLQIVIDLDGPTTFNAFALSSPVRVVVDIKGNAAANFKNALSFKNRGVSRVRTGIRSEDEARIVLDLNQNYKYKVYTLDPDGDKGHRVVIEVFDEAQSQVAKNNIDTTRFPVKRGDVVLESLDGEGKTKPTTVENKPITLASTERSPTSTPTPTETETPEKVTNNPTLTVTPTVTTTTEATASIKPAPLKTKARDIVVMIDPGHGGKDPGAIGPSAAKEKTLVLSIAKKVKAKIDAMPGMKAVLTRSSDKFIPLRSRLALARKNNADLFISIHADAFTRPEANGSSVYILSTKGATSEAAKWLAQRENAVDLKYGVDISDYDKDISQVLLDIQQNATIESSYIVANKTLSELKKIGKVHKSKVERAGFVVLKSPDIPAMLVETAFISNPQEEKKLLTDSYQDKLATAISKGVERYFDEYLPHHLLLINAP